MSNSDLHKKLNSQEQLPPMTPKMSRLASIVQGIEWHDFEYQQFSTQPKITYSPLTLLIVSSVLILFQVHVPHFIDLPSIQYIYLTILFACLANYILIMRTYELFPYLPNDTYDKRLKISCIILLVSVALCLFVGWNGSGGILFAIGWEVSRGSRINAYKIFYLLIIVGSLMMENNYSLSKLAEFVPGIAFGIIASQIFLFKKSSYYAMTHQFTFVISMLLPLSFPAAKIQVPTVWQWMAIIIGGFIMYFTILVSIRLMQTTRASVVMAVSSGVIMAGTAPYDSKIDIVGVVLMAIGVIFLIKKEFYDIEV